MCTCALACVHYLMCCLMHEMQCVSSEPSYQHDISHLCHDHHSSDPAARSLFPVKLYLHLPQPISRHCPFLWFFLHPSLSKGNNLLFVCQSQRWMECMKSDIGQMRERKAEGMEQRGYWRWPLWGDKWEERPENNLNRRQSKQPKSN